MSNETRYKDTETDVEIVIRGQEEWSKSILSPRVLGGFTPENVAFLLNQAYQRGRREQSEDIRKALGV